MLSTAGIPPDIEAWAARELTLRPGTGAREWAGGSRPLWYAHTADHGPVVLRLEPPGAALAGSDYGMRREMEVYGVLDGSGVPVPRVLGRGRFPAGEVLVMTRAEGSSRLTGVAPEQAASMLGSFCDALGKLHAEGAARAAHLPWARPASIAEATAAEIDRWRLLASSVPASPGDSEDLLVLCAIAWLRGALGSLPGIDDDATLVQGDTGPGNVVFADGRVSAIVDWELAHLGDPAEDLAWVDQRCASLPAPFGDLAARRAAHAAAGTLVPEARIDYHGVFVRVRCAVITGRTVAAGGGALGRAVYEPARHRFRVELADMLLAAVGADPALADPGAPDAEVDARAWFADLPAPLGESPADRLAAREAAVLEAHVRARTDVGEGLADADRRDRIAVLGEPGEGGSRWVAAAEEAGRAGDASVIGQLARSARRDAVLWPDPPRR